MKYRIHFLKEFQLNATLSVIGLVHFVQGHMMNAKKKECQRNCCIRYYMN